MNNLLVNLTVELIGTIIAILGSGIGVYFWQRKEERTSEISFSDKLRDLSKNLVSASEEFDNVLQEMKQVADERELALQALEVKIAEFSKRESEMKKKVEELEKVSIPALDYFLQATEKSEKRSAKRDYMLFIAGLVVSAILSIILRVTLGI